MDIDTTTCIAAIAHKGKVWIGADSAGTNKSLHLIIRVDTKVYTRTDMSGNTWGFGFTSSFRMGQLIQYELGLLLINRDDRDLHKLMVTKFIPRLRRCLSAGGYEHKKEGVARGGVFLVGIQGKIFIVEGDYQVGISSHNYAAVGCGDQAALGALYATKDLPSLEPEERLRIVLKAAESCNAGVRGPFKVIHT